MQAKIDSLLIKIAEQDSTIAAQEKLTKDALRWSNKIEQYSRRENLKIHGLKVEEHEECCDVVARMITKDLGIHLKDGDIAIAHPIPTRVQKTSADGVPFPPPIIVKFSTAARNRRDEVIKRRRQLKGSGQVVYEDLTELNAKTLNRVSKHEDIKQAWSVNGKLFGLTQAGKKVRFDPYDNEYVLA